MTLTRNQFARPRRRCSLWIHLAIVVALCSAVSARCVAQDSKLAPEKRAQIEATISKFMASTHVPGLSVAVVENGEYEWAQGFGFADLENNVPASEHTLYRLGSISKPLTATAALQLWERGKLDLDAPVQKYCPAFPQKPWPISTRQVLGHLGWGWGERNEHEVAGVGHTGGQQGTSTAFVVAPDQRAGVVVLANLEDQDAGTLAREILNILSAASEKKP